jgi:small-conductance mechanosensitive channel
MMIFQEDTSQASSSGMILKKILDVLNFHFVEQPGGIRISIMSLLMFGLVICGAVIVSRYIRGFVSKRVLPRFHHLDGGLQYTMMRVLHYVIMMGAVLWAVKLGLAIDLTGVAVVLGFLSVGVGLQYLAADLASGFILLFERPVRVGDQVKLGEIEGHVKSIRLRSTTLATNDEAMVIVPNSEMVRNRVVNLSYSPRVRIRVPISAAYASDVQEVTTALLEAAQAVEQVMQEPPPKVQLEGFGDSAIDFVLLVWINQPHNHQQIRSDINYQIDRVFRARKLEMPFPQRDLHLRTNVLEIRQAELDMKLNDAAHEQEDEVSH